MNLRTIKHEDKRRTLVEFIDNIPVKSVKVIHVKDKSPLGNHYHKNKDEIFYLVRGKGKYVLTTNAKQTRDWIFEGECIFVARDTIHTFVLEPDSILIEAATEAYDPVDEIRA